jgi:hypothetical protein
VSPKRTDVCNAEQGVRTQLPVDGEGVLHRVAGFVFVVHTAGSANGEVTVPIDRVVGIGG